jgi:hypothetical protein
MELINKVKNNLTAKFLENHSKNIILERANKLEDITKNRFDQILFKEGVSYLPVFKSSKGQYLGTLSRKKYLFSLMKGKPYNPNDFLDNNIAIVDINDSLSDVLTKLKVSSGIIMKIDGEFKKFISSRTVSDSFEKYASQMLLLETVEMSLRDNLNKNNVDFIESLKTKNQHMKNEKEDLKELNDLTFSDYNLIYSNKWDEFDFLENIVSKSNFLSTLNLISQMRNDLFHFRNQIDFDEKPLKLLIKYLSE